MAEVKLCSFGLKPGVLESSVRQLRSSAGNSRPDPSFGPFDMLNPLSERERELLEAELLRLRVARERVERVVRGLEASGESLDTGGELLEGAREPLLIRDRTTTPEHAPKMWVEKPESKGKTGSYPLPPTKTLPGTRGAGVLVGRDEQPSIRPPEFFSLSGGGDAEDLMPGPAGKLRWPLRRAHALQPDRPARGAADALDSSCPPLVGSSSATSRQPASLAVYWPQLEPELERSSYVEVVVVGGVEVPSPSPSHRAPGMAEKGPDFAGGRAGRCSSHP